ncbi:MAG TPA: hypothetical protein VL147_12160 [Devosia sp.]|nr:hypothetical protein [Devosia sp.]
MKKAASIDLAKTIQGEVAVGPRSFCQLELRRCVRRVFSDQLLDLGSNPEQIEQAEGEIKLRDEKTMKKLFLASATVLLLGTAMPVSCPG